MRFGQLDIDPGGNPAVLDTVTWDRVQACRVFGSIPMQYWHRVYRAIVEQQPLPSHDRCVVYSGSLARQRRTAYVLARLSDGQYVFLEFGVGGEDFGIPLLGMTLEPDRILDAYAVDVASVRKYVQTLALDKAPRALGLTPRLGIGTRMSTSVWPGIWQAMAEGEFAANAIQNSVRELNLLEDVLAGRPARSNYLYGFGTLAEGHTGSTFEGLWLAGVIEALKTDTEPRYGADADHITVRREAGGLERAKRILDAARDYTFFTLDVSDIVDYALTGPDRLAQKYGHALEVVAELSAYIKALKGQAPFDLELSIDECPPRMDAAACLTSDAELRFLIEELRRGDVPITHIAPNVGIVKGQDCTGEVGLAELERRITGLHGIALEEEVMLDFHSGDDLRSAARQAIGRATRGRCHFKVSPSLQVIFGEVLHELDPERFRLWWDDTLAYARHEASAGSSFAAQCLREYESSGDAAPAPHHAVFHHYNFASVGRRDGNGQFVHRDKFYDLPPGFDRMYHDRARRFLCDVALDVFDRR